MNPKGAKIGMSKHLNNDLLPDRICCRFSHHKCTATKAYGEHSKATCLAQHLNDSKWIEFKIH